MRHSILWLCALLVSSVPLLGQESAGPEPARKQRQTGGRFPDRTTVSVEWLLIPRKARTELFKAVRQSRRYESEKALKHLKKAVKIYPGFYEAYNIMSIQYLRLNQPQEAIRVLQKSIEVEANNVEAYWQLGKIHLRAKRYQEATKMLRKAHQQNSNSPRILMGLGDAYFSQGRYLWALLFYAETQRHLPYVPHLDFQQGYCNWKLDRTDEALVHFQRYLKEHPNGPKAKKIRSLISDLQQDKSAGEIERSSFASTP